MTTDRTGNWHLISTVVCSGLNLLTTMLNSYWIGTIANIRASKLANVYLKRPNQNSYDLIVYLECSLYATLENHSNWFLLWLWGLFIYSRYMDAPKAPATIMGYIANQMCYVWIDAIVWLIWFLRFLLLYSNCFCCRPFAFDFMPTIVQLFTIPTIGMT